MNTISRRKFLGLSAAVASSIMVLPRHVLGGNKQTAPSDKLNIAGIGVGGQGGADINQMTSENIVALCDVDWKRAAKTFDKFPDVPRYRDFRIMLEKQKDIDAVVIGTPDHVHAVAAMAAIQLGKHVFCEKPLTYSVFEARALTEAARSAGVATQMGNQGHAAESIRLLCEWIWDGAIGEVREVHAWTPHPVWPQGIGRPPETPPIPEYLNWDLWLGPARERPYHPAYAPLLWHYWWDFGGGRLGNFGCHTLDTAAWALNLEHPTLIESSSTQLSKETTPLASTCHYKFPARGAQPSVDLFWYDGGIRPPRPDCLEPGRELPRNGGSLLLGDDGAILSGIWSASPRIIPEKKMRDYEQPEPSIPRSPGHHRDWINACKGGPPASSNFEYGARLTEIVLLGVASLRTATTIQWDGPNMKATNAPQIDPVIHGHFRKGWEI